ncbi:MAG TPA: prephenate dehydrogenase/arogenate dehydrogenase family protein [Thermodesulfovibrionia bacterium]|nr:prephenate dehydrogenase/arogenate dehydrogenase family protein [Thermodesulfovibrionia bacterium]
MDFQKTTIIGLGLIGASLALALKGAGFQGEIGGLGRNLERLKKAKSLGIVDCYWTEAKESVKDADLVVLATHVASFADLAGSIKDSLKKGAVLTDVGSVKGRLVHELEAIMPEGVHYVGAHPIAGRERSGMEAAQEHLFTGQLCILTPTATTDRQALKQISELWDFVGAKPVLMDCFEHDRILGAISHFPHVAAYALVNTVVDFEPESLFFSGSGFKDTTRIALSPAELWSDICQYNKDNILEILTLFEARLVSIKSKLQSSDWDGLKTEFQDARTGRQKIVVNSDYN